MGFNPGGGGGGPSTPAFAFGTAAARPAAAAGNADTGYYATDTGEVTFSDGAAWHLIKSTSAQPFILINGASGLNFDTNGFNLANDEARNIEVSNGGMRVAHTGSGLSVAEGSNAKQGTATLVAGTVTVTNSTVTATSRIMLTPQDNNTAGALRVSARVAGTSFTILSSNAADTGVVAYEIFEVG